MNHNKKRSNSDVETLFAIVKVIAVVLLFLYFYNA